MGIESFAWAKMTAEVSANPICAAPAATCLTASLEPWPRTIFTLMPASVALLESDIIIGITPVESEVGNECDVIRRFHMAGLDAENNERGGRGATDRFHAGHAFHAPT